MIQHLGRVVVVDFIDAAIMDAVQIQQIACELYDLVERQNQRYILLDFSNVKFLSSQMLGVMISLRTKVVQRKGWLGVCGLKKDLHKIFKLTKLDKLFNFYGSEDEALRDVEI